MRKFFFILILLLGWLPANLEAASYKVTPRIIDKEVKPRDIYQETVVIENTATHKVSIFPSVNQIEVDAGGDITAFTPPSMSDNKVTPTSWINLKRAGVELLPKETIELPLTIKINPQAKAGEYHMFISFGSGRNEVEARKQLERGDAPGIIVRLAVNENRSEFLKLGGFYIDRVVTAADNNAINYTLTNPGETEVVPTGEIIIFDTRGREVGAVSVNPEGVPLAAKQATDFTTDVPTDGLFGRYKALLNVDYGATQRASVYDTVFFYVLSWQKLLMVFAGLLVVGVIVTIYLYRRYGEVEEEGVAEVTLWQRETQSTEQAHDINLKKDDS